VSIRVVPCRRLAAAARWNGQAPHSATGAANSTGIQAEVSSWPGTIAIIMTMAAGRLTSATRRRQPAASSRSSSSAAAAGRAAGMTRAW
jgi:hypothetical protein